MIGLVLGLMSFVCLTILPTHAAPPFTGVVIQNDIDGLDGNADADFWIVDYFDTNGRGDANDPTVTIAAPPVTLSGYGATALRMDSGAGTGGSGCARLGGKPFFGTQALDGIRLSELTDLGYSYLVDSISGIAGSENLTPYVNIFVDKDGDGNWIPANDSILIFEPFYTLGAPTLDTWYDASAIGAGATGRWHYAASTLPGVGLFTPNTVDLWTEVIAQAVGGAGFDPAATTIGDLRIANPDPGCAGSTQGGTGFEGTGSGLVIAVGQKSGTPWHNYVGFLDGVVLSTVGTVTTNRIDNLNLIGTPATATIISGNPQTTPVNTAFAPLVVEFRDVNNVLVEVGTSASVSVPGAGASATFTSLTAQTNANGRVSFSPTANGTTGAYTATVASGVATTNFNLTNSAAAALTVTEVFAADVNGLAGDNTDFWAMEIYDTNPSTDNPSGSIDFTVNPSTGYSSFEFVVGGQEGTIGGNPAGCTGAGGKTFFGTNKLSGLTLWDIDQIGYDGMLSAVGAEDTVQTLLPYVNIFVDYNNDGVWLPADDGIMVYDTSRPGNITPPYTLGQWYSLPDLTSGASSSSWFFSVRSPFIGDLGFNQVDTVTGINTFQELLNYPNLKPSIVGGSRLGDLKVVNAFPGCTGNTGPTAATEGTSSGVVFVFGQKNGGGYSNMVAHIDTIRLVTSGGGAFDIAAIYDITNYGAPANITAMSGGGQSTLVSTAFTNPLVALVTDAQGNPVPNVSVTFTVPGAGASATVTTPVLTNSSGQASTSATANATFGTYNVTANVSPALPTPATFGLTNLPPAPTAPSDLSATLNGISQVDLAWTTSAVAANGDQQEIQRSPAGANTWSVVTTLPAADESYTDSASCNVSLDYRIRVFNTNGQAFSNVATIIIPACAADIAVSAGNGQSADINTAYTNPLVAVVLDGSNQPVAGVTVTFIAPVTGASVTFPSGSVDVTDVNGLASVPVTANATVGSFTVVATTPDVSGDAAFFNLTNTTTVATTELLTNGNFNTDAGSPQTVPTGWIGRSLTNDKQKCNAAKSFDGACYLLFVGNQDERGRFVQFVDVTGMVAGQTLTLTASGNAKGGAKGLIELAVVYPQNLRLPTNTSKSQLRWESNTVTYTTQTISHALVGTPIEVRVRIRSRAMKGRWFVDGVSLTITDTVLRLPGN